MSSPVSAPQQEQFHISIPARPDVHDFLKQRGEFHFIPVADKIYRWTKEAATRMGTRSFQKIQPHIFEEIISNSYDAYASANSGEPSLDLMVVVQRKRGLDGKDKIIIKIKDNGTGFKNRPKGEKFQFAATDILEKPADCSIGGMGIGLKHFIREVGQAGGSVAIKNRKNHGCAIYLTFDAEIALAGPASSEIAPSATTTLEIVSQLFKRLISF